MARVRSWWVVLTLVAMAFVGCITAPKSTATGTPPTDAAPASMSTAFVPITPTRIVDSRSGSGVRRGVVPGGGAVTFQATGRGGVETGAVNVVLNVTVVSPAGSGWGTAYPAGTTRPGTSNLNFMAGRTTARQLMVSPSATGQVTIFLSAAAQLVVDVQGFTPADGKGYRSATSTRLMDTRSGAPYAAKSTRSITVLGRGGVPTGGVSAVVLSVVGTRSTGNGWLTVYPHGIARPGISNLNTATGQTVSTQVIVTPGANGAVDLYSAGRSDVVVDLVGYVVSGSNFVPVTPTRVMDQRTSLGSTYGSNFTVKAPAGAIAAFVNLTAISAAGASNGSFTLQPGGTPTDNWGPAPTVSNLNFNPGRISANPALVGLGVDSDVALNGSSTARTQAVADVLGYVVSPVSATLSTSESTVVPASFPYGISCFADGSCAVLDYFGRVLFSQPDGSWRITIPPSKSLQALACSSAQRCVVTDATHQYLWDGMSWRAAPVSAVVTSPALACPGDQFCVLAADKQGFTSADGSTWAPVTALAGLSSPQVSCSSPTACLVVDSAGVQVQWDGSAWTRSRSMAPTNIDALSCPGATCVAATQAGVLWSRSADGSWKKSGSLPYGRAEVACISATRCLAVSGPAAKVYDGSSWADTSAPGNLAGVLACSTKDCTISRNSGTFTRWDGAAFSQVFQPVQWWLGVRAAACASKTACFASGDTSTETWDGTNWSGVASGGRGAMGCLSATLCLSADGQQWTPATGWTAFAMPAGALGELWCEQGGMCVTRTATAIYATSGHGWVRLGANPNGQNVVRVSCPTTSWCMIQSALGGSIVWNGKGYQPAGAAIDGNHAVVSAVTCTSSSWCIATATGGTVVTWNGREWYQSKLPSVGTSSLNLPSAHCDSASSCIVADPEGKASVWNGRFWSQPVTAPGTDFECVATWCMGMGLYRTTEFTPFTYTAR